MHVILVKVPPPPGCATSQPADRFCGILAAILGNVSKEFCVLRCKILGYTAEMSAYVFEGGGFQHSGRGGLSKISTE